MFWKLTAHAHRKIRGVGGPDEQRRRNSFIRNSVLRGPSFAELPYDCLPIYICGLTNVGSPQIAPPIGALPTMATPPIGLRAGSNRQVDRPSQFGGFTPQQSYCMTKCRKLFIFEPLLKKYNTIFLT